MANNLNRSPNYDDEIDLKEIFKILIESKKILISSILIFTIASLIYSVSLKPSFETSAILEIGYVELDNGDRELIESPSDLISDLNVFLLKNTDSKFNPSVSIKSFEGKILNLEIISSSAEKNEDLLNEMISYIDQRHSNIVSSTNQKKNEISLHLENINSKITFIKEKQLNTNQLERSKIEERITRLKTELPIIDLEISQLEQIIIDDTNNLSLLREADDILIKRASSNPTLDQIIFSYKSNINDLNTKKFTNILETKNLNNQLLSLQNASLQSDELFSLEQEQKILTNQLQKVLSQTTLKTRPIGDIQTNTIKPKTKLIISLGIILGIIVSFFLVFIINLIKSLKKS